MRELHKQAYMLGW